MVVNLTVQGVRFFIMDSFYQMHEEQEIPMLLTLFHNTEMIETTPFFLMRGINEDTKA